MRNDFTAIRRLVGPVTKEQLRYIDCFISKELGLFMPVGGACFYALTPEHSHPTYMFVLNFNDQTAVRMDGKLLHGKPGTLLALSPGVPHQELPSDAPPRYICVLISKGFFEREYARYSRARPGIFRGAVLSPGQGLLPLLKRFMVEADSGLPGGRAVLAALGVEICHSLIRTMIKAPAPKSRVEERVEIGRVIEHLHAHLDEKITVESMASVACLSTSHFSRVFRKETGKAPMEYVQELRLERVKKMLLAGDRTMTEITHLCGFGSPSYLSACFQRRYRMTPKEYRRSANRG